MNNDALRAQLERHYQGSAAYLSELENSKKEIVVTDRSTLTPADESPCVQVSSKESNVFGNLETNTKKSLAPTHEDMVKMRQNQKDPAVQAELRKLDLQLAILEREDNQTYAPKPTEEQIKKVEEGTKQVKNLFDDIFKDLA